MSEPAAVAGNSALLRVRTGPLARPLLTRVVAMMLARAECPVDRLDDAMVICDALTAHASSYAEDGRIQFKVITHADGLELRVGALADGGANRLAQATALPGVGDVLTPIADAVRIESPAMGGNDELVLELGFAMGHLGEQPRARASQPAALQPTARSARARSAMDQASD